MELLIISETKIKISLTKTDLDMYSIACDEIDYDTTETRRVVWSLLDEVKKQSGFDAAKSKIFVQIYPSRDGGCEMYVSKLGALNAGLDESLNVKKPPAESKCSTEYYIFNGLNEVLAVCKMLSKQGYSGSSKVYADEDGGFVLAVNGSCGLGFISEFGVKQSAESAELYIKEHCREVCAENAVATLGVL